MKKLLLFVLFSIATTLSVRGQDEIIKAITGNNYNFKVIDGGVVWQYVYTTNEPPAEIIDYFKRARLFKVTDRDSLNICGTVEKQSLDYGKYGFSRMDIAIYITHPLSYDVEIDVKENRYRVTIKNVTFSSATNISMYGVSTNSNTQLTLTEMSYSHKRQKFKGAFLNFNAAAVLSTAFYDTYLIKDSIKESDNW